MNVNAFQIKATSAKCIFTLGKILGKNIVIRRRKNVLCNCIIVVVNELSGFRKTTSGLKVN